MPKKRYKICKFSVVLYNYAALIILTYVLLVSNARERTCSMPRGFRALIARVRFISGIILIRDVNEIDVVANGIGSDGIK